MLHDNSDFIIEDNDEQNWDKISKQHCIDTPNKFREFLFDNNIGAVITQAYTNINWNRKFNLNYDTFIIQAISYISDEESQMGTGTIYATSKYNKNDSDDYQDKPRYDYVYIKYENDNMVLVRILLMIMIKERLDNEGMAEDEEKILLLVQLMYKMSVHDEIRTTLGDVYQWASKQRNATVFDYDIVPVQAIVRPAFVVPVLRDGYNGLHSSYIDRFIVLDRKYFDRSGWDTNSQSYTIFNNVDDQQRYVNENQTAAMRLMNRRQSLQEEEGSDVEHEDESDEEI